MSLATLEHESPDEQVAVQQPAKLRGQTSLGESVAIMLFLSIAQRAVGFVRGVLVCIWLSVSLVGQWDLANAFFSYAAPLVMLGIPGTFGRYLEYYRTRGVLRSVIRRTTITCTLLMAGAWLLFMTSPSYFAEQVFGPKTPASLMQLTATALLPVIAFNYMSELLMALRMNRANAIMQFLTNVLFALLCVALLAGWRTDASAIIVAYSGSCFLLVIGGAWYLRHHWHDLPHDRIVLPHAELWAKLIPFAVWVWITNVLTNGFANVGRYLIAHHLDLDREVREAIIGNLHTAQQIPALLFTLAALIGSTLLPYLSREWEAGHKDRVSAMVNLALKLITLFCVFGSVVVLCFSPLLFETVFKGKFPQGQAVFHLTLMCSAISATNVIAQMYLWCAEKARYSCAALAIGLLINVGLNLLLLPSYGLAGSLIGTSIATGCVLMILYAFNYHWGFQLTRRTLLVTLLPGLLFFGIWPSAIVLSLIAVESLVNGRLLFTPLEREQLSSVAQGLVNKFRKSS